MDLLIRHTEYLLGRRDCVVLPGLGALICATDSAILDPRRPGMMLPPRRRIAFNNAITADDGLLSASVSRAIGVSTEEADSMVSLAVDSLRRQVYADGSASFGHLGYFHTAAEGNIAFTPAASAPVNNRFATLPTVDIEALAANRTGTTAINSANHSADATETPTADTGINAGQTAPVAIKVSRWRKMRNGATGIAASLAILVTLTLFALNPIRMAIEPLKASIAPISETSATASAPQTSTAPRRLTIGLPSEKGYISVTSEEITRMRAYRATARAIAAQQVSAEASRIDPRDRFCVIVASFPTMAQARAYIASSGKDLEVLEKDGKCRVYAATAPTYAAAAKLRSECGVSDAWICRR